MVVVPGTGVECETNRGKPQQSCLVSSGAAGDPQHPLHLFGPCRQIGRDPDVCFFLSTAAFLCSSYHKKQLILNIYESFSNPHIALHSAQSLAKHSWKFACYHFADSQLQTETHFFFF